MPLSYQHFRRILLLDEEAGPLEEELPRLADEDLNRRVAEDLNLQLPNDHQPPVRDPAEPARLLLKEPLCFPHVAVQNLRTEIALVFPSHHHGLSENSYGSGPQPVSPGSVY
nr:spliced protein [Hepatitis B virus]WJZ52905.1 spliced protein [Hepatitis B virus]